MRIYEAMVKYKKADCPLCAPGTTHAGSHINIVHMVTAAPNKYTAWKTFEKKGTLFSKIHRVRANSTLLSLEGDVII